MSDPCSRCRNFTAEGVVAQLRTGGWGKCLAMPATVRAVTVVSYAAACCFSPIRFIESGGITTRE